MGREDIKARRAEMRKNHVNLLNINSDENEEDSPLLDVVRGLHTRIDRDKIYYVKYNELKPYPDDKIRLKLHTGEKRESLKNSIEQDGILDPVLVWICNGEKYIMAGHNRADIGGEINIDIPCLFFENISREKADRIVVVTNLYNRQYKEMKPSELSNMLSVLIDSYEEDTKENIYEAIDNEFKLSKRQILIYLRLKKLIPELLEKVDNGEIATSTGYVISAFNSERQNMLYDFIVRHNIKSINGAKAEALKTRMIKEWDEEYLCSVFGIVEKKATSRKSTIIKVKIATLSPYLTPEEVKDSENVIKNSLRVRNELIQIAEEGGIEYSEDIIKKALKEYLEKNKNE